MISLIAAIDEARGLGKNNQLLCHLPADLKHFKSITMGKPIIMGRKTFQSIGRALPGRLNIVLTQSNVEAPDVEVAISLQHALSMTENLGEIMVIGGAGVFQEALPLASRVYLTVIHHRFEADVFFPTMDEDQWDCVSQKAQASDSSNFYGMTFYQYNRLG